MSINYRYILDWAEDYASENGLNKPRILDFGCGAGEIVQAGRERGLDIWGADPYEAKQTDLHHRMTAAGGDTVSHIRRIENDTLPFPDDHFDVIVSNQVFEHVQDLDKPLKEIRRVLRPGGAFLSMFPVRETWWEGHCELYFAHWLKPYSPSQLLYLRSLKRLGFGLKYKTTEPNAWADECGKYIRDYCFYRSAGTIDREWKNTFHAETQDLNDNYILYRLEKSRLAPVAKYCSNRLCRKMLSIICRARAGRVILITNQKEVAKVEDAQNNGVRQMQRA